MFEDLKETYPMEEAKQVIDEMLRPYGDTVRITFREKDAEIIDSYLVRDAAVRRTVCEIIARTGLTERTYADLSAEWQVHNVSYRARYRKKHAKDVSLDYHGDKRRSVRAATRIFNRLNLE